MKKFLLLGAAALMAGAASADVTMTEVWKNTTAPGTLGAEARNVVCVENKVVTTNKAGGLVLFFENGVQLDQTYDVNTFLTENKVGTTSVDEDGNEKFTAYALGVGINADQYGNIIVNLQFPNAASGTEFVVIKADGSEMFHVSCAAPAGMDATRVDKISNVVGDLFGEAYFAVCYNGATDQKVVIYNLYEGEHDPDYSYTVTALTGITNEAKCGFVSGELGENSELPTLYLHYRSASPRLWVCAEPDAEGAAFEAVTDADGNALVSATSTGFAAFNYDGADYVVTPAVGEVTGDRSACQLVNVATGEVLASYDGGVVNYAEDYSVWNNGDGTFNVAFLTQGKVLSLLKVNMNGESGVSSIVADDSNAAVEYYNLQGIKVANPENGVFIKKQGSTATKVVL